MFLNKIIHKYLQQLWRHVDFCVSDHQRDACSVCEKWRRPYGTNVTDLGERRWNKRARSWGRPEDGSIMSVAVVGRMGTKLICQYGGEEMGVSRYCGGTVGRWELWAM
jgi:hypothetical protein